MAQVQKYLMMFTICNYCLARFCRRYIISFHISVFLIVTIIIQICLLMTCDICNVNAQNNSFDLDSSTVLYKNNAKTLGKLNYKYT